MMYKVEQCDRDASADHIMQSLTPKGGKASDDLISLVTEMRAGWHDCNASIQAFAKHRLQALGEVR